MPETLWPVVDTAKKLCKGILLIKKLVFFALALNDTIPASGEPCSTRPIPSIIGSATLLVEHFSFRGSSEAMSRSYDIVDMLIKDSGQSST